MTSVPAARRFLGAAPPHGVACCMRCVSARPGVYAYLHAYDVVANVEYPATSACQWRSWQCDDGPLVVTVRCSGCGHAS